MRREFPSPERNFIPPSRRRRVLVGKASLVLVLGEERRGEDDQIKRGRPDLSSLYIYTVYITPPTVYYLYLFEDYYNNTVHCFPGLERSETERRSNRHMPPGSTPSLVSGHLKLQQATRHMFFVLCYARADVRTRVLPVLLHC